MAGSASGRIDVVESLGSTMLVHVELATETIVTALVAADPKLTPGDTVEVHIPRDHIHVFHADTGERLQPDGEVF